MPLSRSWRLSFLGAGVVFAALALVWCFGMVSDGFQTQGRGSWIPGKERAEPILAGAVEIDGRKDCICKFSPIVGRGGVAGDVTTASRAAGGKVPAGNWFEKWRLVQGLPSSSGEEDKKTNSQESEIPELREQVGWSCEQRGEAEGQSCPARRESGMEDDWSMEVEKEFENVENKRKLDEQRNRLQKELPDVEKLSFIPQEIQRGLKEGMQQQQLQDIEHKRHAEKELAERKCSRTRRDAEAQRGCQAERGAYLFFCRTKSRTMKDLKRKWKHNFKVCGQGRKEEAATPPKGSTVASIWMEWESSWAFLGAEKPMYHFALLRGMLHRMFDAQKSKGIQRLGGSEGLPATPCVDLVRLPDARSDGGVSGNLKTPGFRKRSMSESTGGKRKPMEDGSNL